MKNIINIFTLLIILGCNTAIEKPKKPDQLITEAKMADIMYDIFLLNAAKGVNKTLLENSGIDPEQYVFEKHGIDSTQFANSNNYYSYDTKTYESILQRVKDKIDVEKKEYEAIEDAEEQARARTADSLREVRAKTKDSLINIKDLKPIELND